MKATLYCPRCGCSELVRLAANDISPFRGYRCQGCQRRLRDRGSLALYLVVLVIGLLLAVGMLLNLDRPEIQRKWPQAVFFGVSGALVVGYSLVELCRPTPRRSPRDTHAVDGWFVARHGAKTGPWSLTELRQQVHQGLLTPHDMVQLRGTDQWQSAGQIVGLFAEREQ